jgi:hypothetical protein
MLKHSESFDKFFERDNALLLIKDKAAKDPLKDELEKKS